MQGKLAGGFCAGLVAAGCASDDTASSTADPVEIGILVQQDDPGDTRKEYGAALVAVRAINEAGGLSLDGRDRDLELVAEDHGGSAELAVQALERLADRGVTAVVGPPWSSLALGTREDHADGVSLAAKRFGTLLISASATSSAITGLDDDDLQWRTIPSDTYQAALAAETIAARGLSRASVLARDDAWGQGLATAFEAAFSAQDGVVASTVFYDVTGESIPDVQQHEYAEELTTVFDVQPDVVLLFAFDETFQITKQVVVGGYLAASGEPPLFFGSDANFTADLLKNGAPEVLRHMIGTSPSVDETSAEYQSYVARAEAAGLDLTDAGGPYRADAAFLLALAMQKAGATDAEVVKTELQAVSRADADDVVVSLDTWGLARETLVAGGDVNYEGATGPIEFSDAGDPTRGTYVIWKVVEPSPGTFEYDLSETVAFVAEQP